jgi:hypothetical protein
MIDNALRGRFNAWLFDSLEGYMHGKYAAVKPRLLAGAPSVVVELGPGAGANLRYLSPGTRLIAIEPNLGPPNPVMRGWDYGTDDEAYPCWSLLEHKASNTGIAYCESGFGPGSPWGLVFSGSRGVTRHRPPCC